MRLAEAKGIGVNLDLVDPAPLWATSNPPRADAATVSNPDPAEFGEFVQAVGARYSGLFTPPAPAGATPPPAQSRALPLPPATAAAARAHARADAHAAQAATGPLPRVAYWSLWNEPNQGAWLAPQWQDGQPASPRLYRALVDAAWTALAATGHQSDMILTGETAPKGSDARTATAPMKPLVFLRALYCVDKGLHPLQGAAADAVGCPTRTTAPTSRPRTPACSR